VRHALINLDMKRKTPNYNFIFVLGILVSAFIFFPNLTKAASISGGTCQALPGGSCPASISGDLFGYGPADWVGSLWFNDTGLGGPIVGGGSSFSTTRTLSSGSSVQVSLVVHGPPPDGWVVRDFSCCGPATISATAPPAPTASLLSSNTCTLPPGVSTCQGSVSFSVDNPGGWTVWAWANTNDGWVNQPYTSGTTLSVTETSGQTATVRLYYYDSNTQFVGVKYEIASMNLIAAPATAVPIPVLNLSNGQRDFISNIPGPGWTITGAQKNSVIDWMTGAPSAESDPNGPAAPFAEWVSSGQSTDANGSYQQCPAGTICGPLSPAAGHWQQKARVPSGAAGAESNIVDFRGWPMSLSIVSRINTYDASGNSVILEFNPPITISPSIETPGSPLFSQVTSPFTAAFAYPLGGSLQVSYTGPCPGVYPNASAGPVTDLSGNNLSINPTTPCRGSLTSSQIIGTYNRRPTFVFNASDARIRILSTLDGASLPAGSSLPANYEISHPVPGTPNTSITTNNTVGKGWAGGTSGALPWGLWYSFSYTPQTIAGKKLKSISCSSLFSVCTDGQNGNAAKVFLSAGDETIATLNFYTPTLTISPTPVTKPVGSTQQFTAMYDPDGSAGPDAAVDVSDGSVSHTFYGETSNAAWSSSNTAVATVDPKKGLATAVSNGTSDITVTYAGLSAKATLTVSAIVVTLPPPPPPQPQPQPPPPPPPATLSTSPSSLSFTGVQNGANPSSKSVTITNSGGAGTSLNWSATKDAPWMWLLLPTSGTLGGGASANQTVNIDTTGLAPGSYSGSVTVTATSGGSSVSGNPKTITVNLTVTAPGLSTITLSCTNNCTFTGVSGGANPAAQTLSVGNSGTGALNWNATTSSFWLTLAQTSGSIPAGNPSSSIGVSVNAQGLPAGIYRGRITVSAANSSNSPQTQDVIFKVGSATGPKAIIDCNPSDCNIKRGDSLKFINNSTP